MARSQQTFNKREKEKKREQKRLAKQKKKDERKAQEKAGFDSMIAYVDENGMITDTPPDLTKKTKVEAESIQISVPKKEDEDPMHYGTVDYYNHDKGFGFIIDKDSKEKYFVHVNDLNQPITAGDKVTYELARGQRGMNAVNVSQDLK
ncbi:cold shock domain-containing protein [Puteibacter caeruleilacunae]|nr:cold shock domain-containing protein [Puteibacter caeruleilacunae]